MNAKLSIIPVRDLDVQIRDELCKGLYTPAMRYIWKFHGKYFHEELIWVTRDFSNKKESVSSLVALCDGRTGITLLAVF